MQNNLRFLLLALLGGGVAFTAACGDLEEDCDPAVDEGCVCTLDDTGAETDDCVDGSTSEGDACTCALEGGNNADPNNSDPNNSDPNNSDPNNSDPNNSTEPSFRFVLVEDLTPQVSGDFPGSDVDAISVVKSGGDEFFATSFEADTNIDCTGNQACDPSNLLGAPDAVDGGNCFGGGTPDGSTFTALNQGFVIVGFADVAAGDITIENGDAVHVYEVGATECGRFDDDPFAVSVSVSNAISGNFIEIGTGGNGSNIVPVSGL